MLYLLSLDSYLAPLKRAGNRALPMMPKTTGRPAMNLSCIRRVATTLFATSLATIPATAFAQVQSSIRAEIGSALSYSDLADLSDSATVVARAEIRKVAALKPEQAVGVPAGTTRVYIEARTSALLAGPALGESLHYLADVPLDGMGRLPKLKKTSVLVFARPVEGRPGELRLVTPNAQVPWDPATEATTRAILTELVAPGAPPRITGLREALHVQGNLVGEGETQLFLATEGGAPVSLSVVHRPGQPTVWGVSFSEIVDQAARPPAPRTLAWYRLACFLPTTLPQSANLSGSPEDQEVATDDYALVLRDLGPCGRTGPTR
jgi:hypothetical protein